MSEVKTNAVEKHPIKKFLVDLFSARAGLYFKQNHQVSKVRG
ncbi:MULTISPECIES: hypothetical protein [Acinetobacter]|nr:MULTISPECIES: hypothetical protein [Acinetobacter]EEH67650.1 hypothetical protein HMPREF0023_2803 [Acinetobacter sp. ATCC 27244]SUU19812.1 Uncharacterised protein [Acinetobacter haemolyticus]